MIEAEHASLGPRWLVVEGAPELLFTENETNTERLFGARRTARPYVKDGINDYVVHGAPGRGQPARRPAPRPPRTTACALAAGETGDRVRLRLANAPPRGASRSAGDFDAVFARRLAARPTSSTRTVIPACLLDGRRSACCARRFAGLLWTKQFYHYDVERLAQRRSGAARRRRRSDGSGRNHDWTHLYNADVISMPDKWEYPWYAAWDLAFHCIPLALVDPDFAKEQLVLLLREWYMHPNGQIPAYEWAFGDVNPPVHAWAAWRVYKIDKRRDGDGRPAPSSSASSTSCC